MNKFLLLMGPSGVGKTTLIKELFKLDDRFHYISPDITRPLRANETDKRSITNAEMDRLEKQGAYLIINTLFDGIRYATPRQPIFSELKKGNFPILDWPIANISVMVSEFPVYAVYVAPPSLDELELRLKSDSRDENGLRLKRAREELSAYWNGLFNQHVDLHTVTHTGKTGVIAHVIYKSFLETIKH